jgi:AmmeMemoRadiSam system protein A
VSLHRDGELRGCIGNLEGSKTPLHRLVAEMAVAAATEDHRFAPLRPDELRTTEIEVSVLGPLVPARPEDVSVGPHGLYVVQGRHRGVLLPQVPLQYGWDRETFLDQTCRKAGLPADAWRDPETLLWTFTAEVFSDADVEEDAPEPFDD